MVDPSKGLNVKSICTILASSPLFNALCSVWDIHKSASQAYTQTSPISKLGGWKHITAFNKSSETNRHDADAQTNRHDADAEGYC